uniref:Putative secreted protein n=1 Tax=Anopheles darlingi TaxID=43151 RepID=A0A2M4DRK4_ANODA
MIGETELVITLQCFLVVRVGVLGMIVVPIPIVRLHHDRFIFKEVPWPFPTMTFLHHGAILDHLLVEWINGKIPTGQCFIVGKDNTIVLGVRLVASFGRPV